MPTIINSGVHWQDNNGVCHAALISAGTDDDDSTADILVQDTSVNIVGVGLVRLFDHHAAATKDATGNANGKWHYAPICATGPSAGY